MLFKEGNVDTNQVLTPRVSRRTLLAGAAAIGAAVFGSVFLSSDGSSVELGEARVDLVAVKENLQFVGDKVSSWIEGFSKGRTPKVEVPSPGMTTSTIEIPERGITISTAQESNGRHLYIQRTDVINKLASPTGDTRITSITFSVDNNNEVVSAGSETTVYRGNPPQLGSDGKHIQLEEDQQYLTLVPISQTEEFGSLTIRGNDYTPPELTTQPKDTNPLTGKALKAFNQSVADAMQRIAS